MYMYMFVDYLVFSYMYMGLLSCFSILYVVSFVFYVYLRFFLFFFSVARMLYTCFSMYIQYM